MQDIAVFYIVIKVGYDIIAYKWQKTVQLMASDFDILQLDVFFLFDWI